MIITLYQNKYSKSNRVNYLPTQLRYLWSGAYRCESRSTWSIDRQVTRNNRWGSFTLTHNPTKFDYHWHWETGMHLFDDTMWLHDRWVAWLDVCSQLNLSHTLLKLVAIDLAKVEVKHFFDITWSHDQWFTSLGGWDNLTLSRKGYSKSKRPQ